jgi:cytochrome c5
MNVKYLLSGFVIVAAACGFSKAAPQPKTQPTSATQTAAHSNGKQTAASQGSVHGDEGQRIFEQNCSRCHNAPDGFSPRITGTVLRHMRVRASLSQHDEQELLRFMNP